MTLTPCNIRYIEMGGGTYLKELYEVDSDKVLESHVTRYTDPRYPIIPPPPGHEERERRLSARRALLRLLTRTPNRIVTHAEVEAEAGHSLSRAAVSQAATSLRRDIAVRSKAGHGGGYVLLVPGEAALVARQEGPFGIKAYDLLTCEDCAHYTSLGHCRELDRETDRGQWCWGWTRA